MHIMTYHIINIAYIFIKSHECDGRPVWSRTSDCQSGNPGSNPGRRILIINYGRLKIVNFLLVYKIINLLEQYNIRYAA